MSKLSGIHTFYVKSLILILMNAYKLSSEQHEILCSMEEITVSDVQNIMQKFSSGKVKTPEIGRFRITNKFIPMVKNKGLLQLIDLEEKLVFFAVEKFKTSFFSKASYRVFIWPFLSEEIFAVPIESVVFRAVKPKIESRDVPILERTYMEERRWYAGDLIKEKIPTTVITGFETISVRVWPCQQAVLLTVKPENLTDYKENLQSCEFRREFVIYSEQIIAQKDLAVYCEREKNGGCRSNTQNQEPMYYLRHGFVLS